MLLLVEGRVCLVELPLKPSAHVGENPRAVRLALYRKLDIGSRRELERALSEG